MKWPFVSRARFSRVERLSERWGIENCRLWEALMWIDTYEPQIVSAAEDRFGININQAVVTLQRREPS